MDLKKLSKVTDNLNKVKDAEEWIDLIAGIGEHVIGKVSKDLTKFKPSLGHFMSGYKFWEKYRAGFPKDKDAECKKALEKLAKSWKVDFKDLKIFSNDSYESGYIYVKTDKLGKEVKFAPNYAEYLEDTNVAEVTWEGREMDSIIREVLKEYPEDKIWWRACVYDQ